MDDKGEFARRYEEIMRNKAETLGQRPEARSKPIDEARPMIERLWAEEHDPNAKWGCRYCGFQFTGPEDQVQHFSDNNGMYWQRAERWCRGLDLTLEPKLNTPTLGPVPLSEAYQCWLLTCVTGSPEWADDR